MVSYKLSDGRYISLRNVLILVVVDNGLVLPQSYQKTNLTKWVLILVVVDNGLVPWSNMLFGEKNGSLNPCCSGQWSRTANIVLSLGDNVVLILVVVDNGLVHDWSSSPNSNCTVLILVVVDNGLVLSKEQFDKMATRQS